MPNVLKSMIRRKRREVDNLPAIDVRALRRSDRDFAGALQGPVRRIIAELKCCSPSSGLLCPDYQPARLSRRYEAGGAAALSVLTDQRFFGGHPSHVVEARLASSLAVLRKDIILHPSQILESRRMGADACLLIVAALEIGLLRELKTRIEDLGMAALIEVHDERELETALRTDPEIIGINNRSLKDLSIDTHTVYRLSPLVPVGVVVVSESGMTSPQQIRDLPSRVDAALVGTALMESDDPVTFLREATGVQEAPL